jgi:hypothetical protein
LNKPLKGILAWNHRWYALDGAEQEPLSIAYPQAILQESLSARRESEIHSLSPEYEANPTVFQANMQASSGSADSPNLSLSSFLSHSPDLSLSSDLSHWRKSHRGPQEIEWIADFPRHTWIPEGLLDEWPDTQGGLGVMFKQQDVSDLVTLFESVCGPLNGEYLGWQRIPGMDMAQLFALPSAVASVLNSAAEPLSLHNASALWAQYWMDASRNTEIIGRHLAIIRGDRDFGLWIFERQRLLHHGRYLWNTTADLLYHLLARRSEPEVNCVHFLQRIDWSAEERGILHLSFDHIFINSQEGSDLDKIRHSLTRSLLQWNLKYG